MPEAAAGEPVSRVLAGTAETSTGSRDRSFTNRTSCPPDRKRRFAYESPRRVVGSTLSTVSVEPSVNRTRNGCARAALQLLLQCA